MIATLRQTVVREMTLEDVPDVLEIDRVSFSNPWPERSYHYELKENPAAQLFVTEDPHSARVMGYLGCWLIGDEVHISTFAVHPESRGQGIGRDMLVRALGEAARRGARVATLEVRESNAAAIHLYEKVGFIGVGKREGYYRDNDEDAILMTLHRLPRPKEAGEE